jgi:branched-chain amino acid transport system permease protein
MSVHQPAEDTQPEGAQVEAEAREAAFPLGPGRRFIGLGDAVRDALVAAVIAVILTAPFLGLYTAITGGRLAYTWRPWAVVICAAVVFLGRLFINLVWQPIGPTIGARVGALMATGPRTLLAGRGAMLISIVAVAFAVLLPWTPLGSREILDQGIKILIFTMIGWGLNVVVGLAGLLDLGYIAFFAFGAYSFALLNAYFDLGFWTCLPLAGLIAALAGIVLGFPVLRLRGDYLAVVTLAFGEIIHLVLQNWDEFTGGPQGLRGIPPPTLFGIPFTRGEEGFAARVGIEYSPIQRIIFLYYVVLVLALVTSAVTLRLRRLPIGQAWEAMREDEIACRSLGINTTTTKLTAFGIGAMFAGFAGAFFASRQGFISPESFVSQDSFMFVAFVVLGGLGSQIGVVIAVAFITIITDLQQFQLYRMLIVGVSMVLIMVWRPRGLISTRRPTVRLPLAAKPAPA